MPKSKKAEKTDRISNVQIYAVVAVALVIVTAIITIIYLSQPPSFTSFKSAFKAASQIAIFAMYNGTHLGIGGSSAASCAIAVIEQLHRTPNTISFFEANQTSCTFATGGLGGSNNTTTVSIGRCINMSKSMPTLYINYSTLNETVVGRGTLYVSGNLLFLRECGIAQELT